MGSRFDADDVSMLVELCERARDEELSKWKMPLMGRVSDRRNEHLGSYLRGHRC